jgi:hypothetical protein
LTLDTIWTTAAPEIAPAMIDPTRTAISSNTSGIFHFSQTKFFALKGSKQI